MSKNCQVTLGNLRRLRKFRAAGTTFGKDGREMLESVIVWFCHWKGPKIVECSSSQKCDLRSLYILKIEDPREFLCELSIAYLLYSKLMLLLEIF